MESAASSEILIKECLNLTKQLHQEIGKCELPPESAKKLKRMAAEANKTIVKLRRQSAMDAVAASTREQILKQALKEELIDRDANAARIAERMRVAAERGVAIAALAQRSEDAVQQINASIVALCPWQMGVSCGVPLIAAANSKPKE